MESIKFVQAPLTTARTAFNYLLLAGLFSAVSCSAQQTTQASEAAASTSPDPAKNSRLRMFGQNGASAVLFRGSACVKDFWSEEGEKVSGGLGSAFSSFFGSVSNTSLGIPETETSRNLASRDSLLSKAYFREYLIPSGQPSSMRLGFQDASVFYLPPPQSVGQTTYRYERINRGCHGAISFVPDAQKDYEVGFTWVGGACHAVVNEVVRNGDAVELIPVPIAIAPDC